MKEAIEIVLEQEAITRTELAAKLGITPGMLSHYSNHDHYPRLNVAAKMYANYRIQIEPFTETALSNEMERQLDGN